jgi:hypothetical protein
MTGKARNIFSNFHAGRCIGKLARQKLFSGKDMVVMSFVSICMSTFLGQW